MEKSVLIALLFDFYGGLLTEKQRGYLQLRYCDDLSLAEIAEGEGVTRQGARDALMRAEKTLLDAEAATHLFARFGRAAEGIESALALANQLADKAAPGEMADAAAALVSQLNDLKGQVSDGI